MQGGRNSPKGDTREKLDQARVDHVRCLVYTKIGSLSEMCRPQEKLGITRFSKCEFDPLYTAIYAAIPNLRVAER